MADKWQAIFTFPLSGEADSRLVAIVPYAEKDPNRGLSGWFFDPYTAPVHHESGRITDEQWMYDTIQFWRQPDGSWMREWVPEIGPNPIWTSVSSPGDKWSPLLVANWTTVLARLAAWQISVFRGAP